MMGLKYIAGGKSIDGKVIQIEIHQEGYSGVATELAMGSLPVLRMDNGGRIKGTSLEFSLVSKTVGALTDLYTTNPYNFKVLLKDDGNVIWTGYILREQYAEQYGPAPYPVAIIATDGLGLLKDVAFELNGQYTPVALLYAAFGKIHLPLDLAVYSLLRGDANGGDPARWIDRCSFDVTGFAEGYYEALEKLLETMNAYITQRGNRWILESSPGVRYQGLLYSAGSYVSVISADIQQPNPIGALSLTIEPSKKEIDFNAPLTYPASITRNHLFNETLYWFRDNANYNAAYGESFLELKKVSRVPQISQTVRLGTGYKYSLIVEYTCIGTDPTPRTFAIFMSNNSYTLRATGWDPNTGQITVNAVPEPEAVSEKKKVEIQFQSSPAHSGFEDDYTIVIAGIDNTGISLRLYQVSVVITAPREKLLTAIINSAAVQDADDHAIHVSDRYDIPNRLNWWNNTGATISDWKHLFGSVGDYNTMVAKDVISQHLATRIVLTGAVDKLAGAYFDTYSSRYFYAEDYTYDLLNRQVDTRLIELAAYADVTLAAFADGAYAQASPTGGSTGGSSGGSGLILGESSQTAYRGDRGKIAYDHSQSPDVHFADVPNDDTTYARNNKQWVPLLGESAQTAYRGDRGKIAYDHSQSPDVHFADAPNDDITYARNNKQWVPLPTPGGAAVRLSTNKQVFEYDESGNLVTPGDYSWIYTTLFNISADTIYYQFSKNGTTLQNTTASVLSYVPPATYSSPDVITVVVRQGYANGTVLATDTISMYGIKPGADGQDAYTVVLSNPAHAFPADANGNVTDYSGSGTDIRVWKGIIPLDYGTGALTFSVSAAGTNITPGSASTVNANIRRYGNANNMISASAAINFTITVRDKNSVETVFTQVMTFAISKAGQDGTDGEDGAPGPVGPSLVFRGEYNAAATYVGNSKRIDMVKYTANGKYYAALADAGSFSGKAPIDAQYWEIADGQFEFVATKLLFAESTYVRNLIAEQLKTAESGRRVEINAGDKQQVAIYDAYESLKVLVKPEPISTLAVIQSGSATAYQSPTADVATKHSFWSTPNFGAISYQQVSTSFVVTFDGTLEIEIGTISLSAGKTDGTYCAALSSVTVVLEKYTAGTWSFVGYIGTCSEYESSKYVSNTIKGLTAGTYRLVANHEHFSWTDWIPGMPGIQDSCSAFSGWNYYSGSAFSITIRRVIAQTEIGTDGIASIWATNKYFHFSQAGLYIKMGTKTFEVSEAGVKINGIIHN